MTSKTLSAGDIIEARCTRCREIRNHTIVAMVGERPARVQCNTCGGVHNYREAKPAGKPAERTPKGRKAAAPRAPRKEPGAADRKEWESLSATLEREQALPYDMNGSYKVQDVVEHPVFGLGVVKGVAGPNKIEILFKEGVKLLRCG